MIARSPELWQRELAEAVRDPVELLQRLELDAGLLPAARRAAALFPLRVTRHLLDLMRRGDPTDPLLRQVLPLDAELTVTPGFVADPVGDRAASRGAGILHKYHGRALLIATGACAVHCRYCFRRHFPYAEESLGHHPFATTLAELATLPGLSEVILSGGDPLTLSDRRLTELLRGIERLPGIRRLRIHTRLPVVLPSRLTAGLHALLSGSRLQTTVVLHVNHPQELAPILAEPLARLRQGGVTLLNQSVLLRGINDAAPVLAQLSESLFELGVLPYYLHQLDAVAGAGHFAVPDAAACGIAAELRAQLPGYLAPRLVVERPGAASKLPLETVC
jgi:EF-P beta-lysylation protein EpmB